MTDSGPGNKTHTVVCSVESEFQVENRQTQQLSTRMEKTKTNIIYFELDHPKVNSSELLEFMGKKNIRFFELAPNWFRLVTHSGISNESIDYVVNEFDHFFAKV